MTSIQGYDHDNSEYLVVKILPSCQGLGSLCLLRIDNRVQTTWFRHGMVVYMEDEQAPYI